MCHCNSSLKKIEKELEDLKKIYVLLTPEQRIQRLKVIRKKILQQIVEGKGKKNIEDFKKVNFLYESLSLN